MSTAIWHSAFLFDYQAFQRVILPTLIALDAGNDVFLRKQVDDIRQQVGLSENWILHNQGTALGNFGLDHDLRYRNALWGHWLLIILSTFLRPCVSLGQGSFLGCVLSELGWDDEDVRQLHNGLPTVKLLKPEAPYWRGMTREWSLPYWYHIGTQRSFQEGWLPVEGSVRLLELLLRDRQVIRETLGTRVKSRSGMNITKCIPESTDPEFWCANMLAVYERAIDMLTQSISSERGLYLISYSPEDW